MELDKRVGELLLMPDKFGSLSEAQLHLLQRQYGISASS